MARYRNLLLLAAVLFAQLLGMAYQLRRQQDVPLIRNAVVYVVAPVQAGLRTLVRAAQDAWEGYIFLWGTRRQNLELRDQLDRLKLENHRLRELAEQGRRLQALFALREQAVVPSVAAQVLSAGSSETARIVLIDKGANDGLTADLPVMVPDGVVGKVLHVFPSTAQVILITDPYSGVAALLGDSRIHGIVKGQNQSECVLAYVPNGDPVQPGQIVYTSGEDRIFPKGLPVGVVVEARPGVEFQQIKVRPLAKLNRLEEVLVLLQSAGEVAAFQQAAGAGDHDAGASAGARPGAPASSALPGSGPAPPASAAPSASPPPGPEAGPRMPPQPAEPTPSPPADAGAGN